MGGNRVLDYNNAAAISAVSLGRVNDRLESVLASSLPGETVLSAAGSPTVVRDGATTDYELALVTDQSVSFWGQEITAKRAVLPITPMYRIAAQDAQWVYLAAAPFPRVTITSHGGVVLVSDRAGMLADHVTRTWNPLPGPRIRQLAALGGDPALTAGLPCDLLQHDGGLDVVGDGLLLPAGPGTSLGALVSLEVGGRGLVEERRSISTVTALALPRAALALRVSSKQTMDTVLRCVFQHGELWFADLNRAPTALLMELAPTNAALREREIAPTGTTSVLDELERAHQLHTAGALTDVEFMQLKRRLLDT